MLRKGLFAALLAALPMAAAAQDVPDLPGPNLVIEVAGKGEVVIDLLPDVAPKHVAQIVELAKAGAYDGVVFHRVIDGFMAQTGDVQFGRVEGAKAAAEKLAGADGLVDIGGGIRIRPDQAQAGIGGSDLPDIPAEFSKLSFQRGIVGAARSNDPDSANSQFFITFGDASFLDGKYTVFGRVISGMDVVDAITRGEPPAQPDVMTNVTVAE